MPRLESDGVVRDPGDTSPIPSPLLQERYGPGYFRGENSGFSRDGYENAHATWRHWMDFVRAEVGAGARWVDVGCAYGFLVAEACESGFRAVGFDASRFAAGQAAQFATRAAGRVACARGANEPVVPFAWASTIRYFMTAGCECQP